MDCHSARLQQSKGSGGGQEDIAEGGDAGDGAGDAFAHGRRLHNANRNRGNLMMNMMNEYDDNEGLSEVCYYC